MYKGVSKELVRDDSSRLLNHDKGRTWRVMYDIFNELGYDVKFRVLNSCDYGIPQHRERVYCLSFKKKTTFEFPAPIELEYKMYDFLEDKTIGIIAGK